MDGNDRRQRVAEEAAEWWALLQGPMSRAQRQEYVEWLRESVAHVREILRLAQVHDALERFERWSAIPTEGPLATEADVIQLPTQGLPPSQPGTLIAPPRPLKKLAFVAAILAVAICAVLVGSRRGDLIQTDRGERREVALADGSVMQIDPETRLRVEYGAHWRRVVLERGRALFHVAKNPQRPFLVEVRDTTVRAVGTAFAVERDAKDVVITVAEGKVAISPTRAAPAAGSSTEAATGVAGGDVAPVYLSADEQLTVDSSGTAEPARRVESERALAWATGKLIFQNESVRSIAEQFNRYNRIQIIVHDPLLASRTVTGVFNASDPESFIAFIQALTAVKVSRNDDADIILDAPPN
jgi:transmembrane sensor